MNIVPQSSVNSFILVYASQTDQKQSKSIAELIYKKTIDYGFSSRILNINALDEHYRLEDEFCVVFVVSTTGDGDPPDDAMKFWRRIRKINCNSLSKLNFTLLGLGDSNYSNFCNFGRSLFKKLLQHGGQCFYPPAWADDSVGLEYVVDPWIDGFWDPLKKLFEEGTLQSDIAHDFGSLSCGNKATEKKTYHNIENTESFTELSLTNIPKLHLPSKPNLQKFTIKNFEANTNNSCNCNQNGSTFSLQNSEVLSIKLIDLKNIYPNSSLKCGALATFSIDNDIARLLQPGDSISLIAQNDPHEVKLLLNRLGYSEKDAKSLHLCRIFTNDKSSTSLSTSSYLCEKDSIWKILMTSVDIRSSPKKSVLRLFAKFCDDVNDKERLHELSSREGADLYHKFIRMRHMSILDILYNFVSCKPPLEILISCLPRLTPRPYSVCNSCHYRSGILQIAFNIYKFNAHGDNYYTKYGLVSGIFNELLKIQKNNPRHLEDNEIYFDVFLRSNQRFRLPNSLTTPMILVGPGLGAAPFRGFLEHIREHCEHEKHQWPLKIYLFTGCQSEAEQLFQQEFLEFVSDGILSEFRCSLSRQMLDDSTAKYVQHDMLNVSTILSNLLTNTDAKLYVCGDAKNMSVDVYNAVLSILQNDGKMSVKDSKLFLSQLRDCGRYLEDVWT